MTDERPHLKVDDKPNSAHSVPPEGLEDSAFYQDVTFVPGTSNGITIESPLENHESQPLLETAQWTPHNVFPGNFVHKQTFSLTAQSSVIM